MSSKTAEERLARLLAFNDLLGRVAREIGPALELEPVLRTVLRATRTLVRFRGGSIALVQDGLLHIVAADPAEQLSDEVRRARLPVGKGLTGRAAASGDAVYSPNLDEDPRVNQKLRRLGSNREIVSYLAVPLVCLGEVVGVLQIDSSEIDAFDEDDQRLLTGLATQVAGSIESARRHEEILGLQQLKNDFVARVSHELRTPVAILSGYVDILRKIDHGLDDEEEQAIEGIDGATHQLRGLVEQLLDIASLQAGVRATELGVVDLQGVLDRVTDTWRGKGPVAAAGTTARVRTDRDVLERILGLLVDNALRYAGGAILEAVAEDGVAVITVRDTGPGVPADIESTAFDRFVRGHERPPGLGLGLSLARALGATIGAEVVLAANTPGEGATFAVRLPVANRATEGA